MRRSIAASVGLALLWCLIAGQSPAEPSSPLEPSLEIVREPSGGFRATATLRLPAPPSALRAVLTNYEEWPALFAGRFRIIRLQREADRVVTELMIRRSPFPGELRLLCETKATQEGELVTTLLEGDFRRYIRRWTFQSESFQPGSLSERPLAGTRATMELSLELDTVVPDWIVKYNLRRELLEHFRILTERALAKKP